MAPILSPETVRSSIELRSGRARGRFDLGFFPAKFLAQLETRRVPGGLCEASELLGSKNDALFIASFLDAHLSSRHLSGESRQAALDAFFDRMAGLSASTRYTALECERGVRKPDAPIPIPGSAAFIVPGFAEAVLVQQGRGSCLLVEPGVEEELFATLFFSGVDAAQGRAPERRDRLRSLASELGMGRIRTVLSTHIHVDHVGPTKDGDHSMWGDARFYAYKNDANAYDRRRAAASTGSTEQLYEKIKTFFFGDGKPGFSIASPQDIWLPNAELIETPGHSPGHCAVMLCLDGKRLLMTGDLIPEKRTLRKIALVYFEDYVLIMKSLGIVRELRFDHALYAHSSYNGGSPLKPRAAVLDDIEFFKWRLEVLLGEVEGKIGSWLGKHHWKRGLSAELMEGFRIGGEIVSQEWARGAIVACISEALRTRKEGAEKLAAGI